MGLDGYREFIGPDWRLVRSAGGAPVEEGTAGKAAGDLEPAIIYPVPVPGT